MKADFTQKDKNSECFTLSTATPGRQEIMKH